MNESVKICEWCREPVGARRLRVFTLPRELGERKLYFHARHLEEFKEANPTIMMKKEEDAHQRTL